MVNIQTLLLSRGVVIVGEKSLDLTYEIQAFTDAGTLPRIVAVSKISLYCFLVVNIVLNSPAVMNSPDLADGQLVEVVYVKRYNHNSKGVAVLCQSLQKITK